MVAPNEGWVLWAGTTGFEGPLDERLDAAASVGYRRVSLSPVDVDRAESSGLTLETLRRAARRHGIRWVLDPVVSWLRPGEETDEMLARRSRHWARFDVAETLRMAEGIDAVSASAVAMTLAPHPLDAMVDGFAQLCDDAAQIGVDVHLEFVPMTVVSDIATAWDIVRIADRANGGLLFDTWHFFRGNPDFALLAEVPGERIFTIQISDAAADPLPSLWRDTFDRRLPGDGDLDLARALGALARIGGLAWMGPEIFSTELSELGAGEAARIAKERIAAI